MTDEYSDLLKKATSLKKSNLNEAILLIEKALKVYVPNYHNEVQAIKKLADYHFLNDELEKSINTLIEYIETYFVSNEFSMRIMKIALLVTKLRSILEKKKIMSLDSFENQLYFYAYAIQGRLNNLIENKLEESSKIDKDTQEKLDYLNSHGKKFITDVDEFNNGWMNEKKLIQIYDNLTKEIKSKLSEVSQKFL